MDFGYICPTELTMLDDKLDEFKRQDCEVLAVSTSSLVSKMAFLSVDKEQGGVAGIRIRLVEDKEGEIGNMFGVMKEDSGYSYRAMIIIDRKGVIIFRAVSDLPIGCGISGALEIVKKAKGKDDKMGEKPNTSVELNFVKDDIKSTKSTNQKTMVKKDELEEVGDVGQVNMVAVSKEGKDGDNEPLAGPPMCDCDLKYPHTVNHHKLSNLEKKKEEVLA